MYGPQDVSDFSIGVDPVEGTLLLFPDNNHPENNSYALDPPDWYVKVEDSHAHLRPYRFGVLLKVLKSRKEYLSHFIFPRFIRGTFQE